MTTNGTGSAPVKRLTSGRVSVAIFENSGQNGTWYSMVPQRSYREDGGDWKKTNNYSRDDAPVLASLLMQAHGWVVAKEESNRLAERATESASA